MEEPQVIVWRPGWRPVRSYLILFGVLGSAAAVGSRQTGWPMLLALAAFLAPATVRALAGGPLLAVTSVRAARTAYVVLIVAMIVLAAVSGKF
jgi:hypothetical protein